MFLAGCGFHSDAILWCLHSGLIVLKSLLLQILQDSEAYIRHVWQGGVYQDKSKYHSIQVL